MGAYQRPIGELKKFAKQFQGVLALVPLLENLDTLGNEEIEKTRLVEKLREEVKSENAKLLKRRKEWSILEDKESAAILQAKERAEEIVEDARQKAVGISRDYLKDSVDLKETLELEIKTLSKNILTKRAEERSVNESYLDSEAKLEATNKELDRLRSIL